mmetsp:Transcript_501/g.1165  ORF Transcript_501/g.1165 Transcript_501/m.1165 type:complete len:294 (+) Transcript_501:176-1057(+)
MGEGMQKDEVRRKSSKSLLPEASEKKNGMNQNLPSLRDHIIICGMPESISDFLAPVVDRSEQLGSNTLILFIWDGELTEDNHDFLQRCRNARLLAEPPLDPSSFEKANMGWASSVLLLTDTRQFRSEVGQLNPELLDAEVIFAYKYIQRKFPEIASRCICEVTENQSVQLIQDESPTQDIFESIYLNRSFAQGRVYSSSLATSILAQSFYSPHILPIISAVLSSQITNVGYDGSMGFGGEVLPCRQVELIQQPVDLSLKGKLYLDAFRLYVSHNLLPLGLYRQEQENSYSAGW